MQSVCRKTKRWSWDKFASGQNLVSNQVYEVLVRAVSVENPAIKLGLSWNRTVKRICGEPQRAVKRAMKRNCKESCEELWKELEELV